MKNAILALVLFGSVSGLAQTIDNQCLFYALKYRLIYTAQIANGQLVCVNYIDRSQPTPDECGQLKVILQQLKESKEQSLIPDGSNNEFLTAEEATQNFNSMCDR